MDVVLRHRADGSASWDAQRASCDDHNALVHVAVAKPGPESGLPAARTGAGRPCAGRHPLRASAQHPAT